MLYHRKSTISQLNNRREIKYCRCRHKDIKPNSIWKEGFRHIIHQHTHTLKLCALCHLHCFQTGSFYLYVKRARIRNHVQDGTALWGKNLPFTIHPRAQWNHSGRTSLPRGSFFLIADDLCWKWVSCLAASYTYVGKRNSGHSTPADPRAPRRGHMGI